MEKDEFLVMFGEVVSGIYIDSGERLLILWGLELTCVV